MSDSRFPSEPPTTPQGKEYLAAMLVKWWALCDEVDRAYLLRLAEQLANRNARKE